MKRDISIDVLKFVAVVAVMNSHMELLYGKYSMLATGGAIGDALFFFCSGFTLFLGRSAGFFNWYKRRIGRIYPTVFVMTILASLVGFGGWDHRNIVDVLLDGGSWFVSCIMIYYVILWFVKTYAIDHLHSVFIFTFISVLLWYFIIGIDADNNSMYGYCYFKWVHYFIYMLLGAVIGLRTMNISDSKKGVPLFFATIAKLIVCIVAFYALCWFKHKDGIYDVFQLMSVAPLIGVVYYFYQLCNTKLASRVYDNPVSGFIVRLVGGLCLEIYLIQHMVFSDKLNFMFPLNIPIFFVFVVVAAYLLRCFARIWSQTFKDGDYDWKEVVRLY